MTLSSGVDPDVRRALGAKFERIADQILKQLRELHLVRLDCGQGAMVQIGAGLLDRLAQSAQHLIEDRTGLCRAQRQALRADARVSQQIIDQLLHAFGALDSVVNVLVGARVDLPAVAIAEELGIARHHPQRLLQIVSRDVSKLLELGIRALQLARLCRQNLLDPLPFADVDDDREHD